jgi:hypothetical protein
MKRVDLCIVLPSVLKILASKSVAMRHSNHVHRSEPMKWLHA